MRYQVGESKLCYYRDPATHLRKKSDTYYQVESIRIKGLNDQDVIRAEAGDIVCFKLKTEAQMGDFKPRKDQFLSSIDNPVQPI
jgi:hypothetical protein